MRGTEICGYTCLCDEMPRHGVCYLCVRARAYALVERELFELNASVVFDGVPASEFGDSLISAVNAVIGRLKGNK